MIDTTLFLGQFWGWMLVTLSLIFLIRGRVLIDEMFQAAESRGFTLFSGYIAFLIGLSTVILNNVWTADWVGVVTLFGWISLLKGVIRLGFPETMHTVIVFFKGKTSLIQLILVTTLALGGWLLYFSGSLPLPLP